MCIAGYNWGRVDGVQQMSPNDRDRELQWNSNIEPGTVGSMIGASPRSPCIRRRSISILIRFHVMEIMSLSGRYVLRLCAAWLLIGLRESIEPFVRDGAGRISIFLPLSFSIFSMPGSSFPPSPRATGGRLFEWPPVEVQLWAFLICHLQDSLDKQWKR